jgi:hypothetical protein
MLDRSMRSLTQGSRGVPRDRLSILVRPWPARRRCPDRPQPFAHCSPGPDGRLAMRRLRPIRHGSASGNAAETTAGPLGIAATEHRPRRLDDHHRRDARDRTTESQRRERSGSHCYVLHLQLAERTGCDRGKSHGRIWGADLIRLPHLPRLPASQPADGESGSDKQSPV